MGVAAVSTAPLPYSPVRTVPTGRPASAGQRRTAGQPDMGYTASGAPVFVFNFQAWATLWLVTIKHPLGRVHAWCYGSPERLISFARDALRLPVQVEERLELDGTLPPIERG